jgi:hypothetical protein
MTICSFCRLREASVDAHIMPRSFVRDGAEPGRNSYLLSTRNDFAKRTQTGVYDSELVCLPCEQRFGPYDDYGREFFQLKNAVQLVSPEMEGMVWQCPVDYAKLKLFILSILWRASASRRVECASVKLGRFEESIRQMIEFGDPGPADRFPILMHRYDNGADIAPLSMPRRTRLRHSSVNYYKMEIAGCAIWTAVDERRLPPILDEVILAPGRPACLFPLDYKTTADWSKMLGILRKIRKQTGRFPV